jgi:RNA polymerase sigma-70 factor (ECF subfamily)
MDARADIRELLDRARRGAPDAIGQIFEAARGHLIDLADRELPVDVRARIGPSDVVQETAVEMHRDFEQFTGRTAEECYAWLREILRHNVVDAVRRYRDALKREAAREVSFEATRPAGGQTLLTGHRLPEGSAIRREEAAVLKQTMARLPDDYRRVLELRYWGGLSFVAMAPELERSPEAVRKLWYRAIERLQEELAAAAAVGPSPAGGRD